LAITERLSPLSNHRKRVNYSGEEKVAILRAHFVEGLLVQKNEVIAELLQEHVQLKKANGDP
jgi:protein-disulfide isomerase-like protein with CxxC motif